ncbi:MAG TPA: hypothetical protein VF771_08170 [Longimicrobiaceae bacterium]
MKKLALDIDTLRVESFEVAAAAPTRGTVRAHDGTWGETCVTQCVTGPCDCVVTIEYGSC